MSEDNSLSGWGSVDGDSLEGQQGNGYAEGQGALAELAGETTSSVPASATYSGETFICDKDNKFYRYDMKKKGQQIDISKFANQQVKIIYQTEPSGTYIGEISAKGVREGQGWMKFDKNQCEYKGNWKDGKMSGKGTMKFPLTNSNLSGYREYTGDFQNNKMSGDGKMLFYESNILLYKNNANNYSTYEGTFKDNEMVDGEVSFNTSDSLEALEAFYLSQKPGEVISEEMKDAGERLKKATDAKNDTMIKEAEADLKKLRKMAKEEIEQATDYRFKYVKDGSGFKKQSYYAKVDPRRYKTFKGTFVNNQMENGHLKFQNNRLDDDWKRRYDAYYGCFKENLPHGKGSMIMYGCVPGSPHLEGSWENGMINGKMAIRYPDGSNIQYLHYKDGVLDETKGISYYDNNPEENNENEISTATAKISNDVQVDKGKVNEAESKNFPYL